MTAVGGILIERREAAAQLVERLAVQARKDTNYKRARTEAETADRAVEYTTERIAKLDAALDALGYKGDRK